MNHADPSASLNRKRNRMMLLAIFALFFGSLFFAGVLRFSGWRPAGMKNKGELLQPPADLRGLTPKLLDGTPYTWAPINRVWRVAVAPPADPRRSDPDRRPPGLCGRSPPCRSRFRE